MEPEDPHFEVEDFAGRKIICTELQWEDHVCGRRDHQYMDGTESEVMRTLQQPDHGLRHQRPNDPRRRSYYRLQPSGDHYMKVVVEFEDEACNGSGKVVTAYMPDSIAPGEMPEL